MALYSQILITWHCYGIFTMQISLQKIKKIQQRAIRFIFNDQTGSKSYLLLKSRLLHAHLTNYFQDKQSKKLAYIGTNLLPIALPYVCIKSQRHYFPMDQNRMFNDSKEGSLFKSP